MLTHNSGILVFLVSHPQVALEVDIVQGKFPCDVADSQIYSIKG